MIGAGAAGIIAAWRAAELGASVTLLEKTDRIGTKILISGGGKCNIAHDGPIESVLKAFRPNEARFIRPAVYRFPNSQIIEMFTSQGLEVYSRPDDRVFPRHGNARDVVNILRAYLERTKVDLRVQEPVRALGFDGPKVSQVKTDGGTYQPRQVILCSGGSSYPNSGTTGDGWKWAREAGHSIVKVRAALAPIYMELKFSQELERMAGVALRDVVLKARQASKEVTRWRGDMLFTHKGISGPTVLGISRLVAERMEGVRWQGEAWETVSPAPVTIEVDTRPDESFEQVNESLKGWITENPRKQIKNAFEELPERLLTPFLAEAGLSGTEPANQITQKSRNRLVEVAKGWPLGEVRTVPLEKGECVAGGVSLAEVDPHTMRSQFCENLLLAGEVLDVAGPVGGYNLQAAFATGFVAGETAAS